MEEGGKEGLSITFHTGRGGGEQFHNSRVLKNSFTFHLHNSLLTDLSLYFK